MKKQTAQENMRVGMEQLETEKEKEAFRLSDDEVGEVTGGSWDQSITKAEPLGALIEGGALEAAYILGHRSGMEETIALAKKQGFYNSSYKKAEDFLKTR